MRGMPCLVAGFKSRGTPGNPDPSLLAAEKIAPHVGRMHRRILTEMTQRHSLLCGFTADEMALCLGIDELNARPRFTELYNLRLIAREGRRTNPRGNMQHVHFITERGRKAIE